MEMPERTETEKSWFPVTENIHVSSLAKGGARHREPLPEQCTMKKLDDIKVFIQLFYIYTICNTYLYVPTVLCCLFCFNIDAFLVTSITSGHTTLSIFKYDKKAFENKNFKSTEIS